MTNFARTTVIATFCGVLLSGTAFAHDPHPNLTEQYRKEAASQDKANIPGGTARVDCSDALGSHRSTDLSNATCAAPAKAGNATTTDNQTVRLTHR